MRDGIVVILTNILVPETDADDAAGWDVGMTESGKTTLLKGCRDANVTAAIHSGTRTRGSIAVDGRPWPPAVHTAKTLAGSMSA